jgi:hypothetical protein
LLEGDEESEIEGPVEGSGALFNLGLLEGDEEGEIDRPVEKAQAHGSK